MPADTPGCWLPLRLPLATPHTLRRATLRQYALAGYTYGHSQHTPITLALAIFDDSHDTQ